MIYLLYNYFFSTLFGMPEFDTKHVGKFILIFEVFKILYMEMTNITSNFDQIHGCGRKKEKN